MKSKKLLIILSLLLVAAVLFGGCSRKEHDEIFRMSDMKDMHITFGVADDIKVSNEIKEVCPGAEIVSQNDVMFGIRSVSEGKLDTYCVGRIYIEKAIEEGDFKNIRILDDPLIVYECALGISELCKIPGFEKTVNDTMEKFISDGTIDEMYERWFGEEPGHMPEIKLDENPVYTINAVTYGQCKPYSFVENGKLTGFDVELLYRLCKENHWGMHLDTAEYPGMLMGLSTGKFDVISANLYVTKDRAENVIFSVPYETQDISVAVRDYSKSTGNDETFFENVAKGFRKTFIDENRWQMILSGLLITLIITLGGFALANILGALFCACSMSDKKGLRIIADVYNRIMQGTPMVVILLIFYYVIFGSSTISGVWVAIFAFGLNSGASLAQLFRVGITGVGKGQTEAALAMGFTKTRAFCGIVLPQAARVTLPGYFSELIGLMKGTAIVGYITVIDLTKTGDLIRSSTYDAFFPLISVAVIYFLISFGILSLLKYLVKKLSPKRVGAKEAEK